MAEEREIVQPGAAALIESMRAFGYTPYTAIADIIDNSIAAGAKNIWIRFHWEGVRSYISILDDGHGMTESALTEAMRPGTASPLDTRNKDDLGRFGLGLKTASFSQCRRLIVASKKGRNIAIRCWDLDYVGRVNEWALLKKCPDQSEDRLKDLKGLESGTLVLLESLDRIVGNKTADDKRAENRFRQIGAKVQEHLSMVFHRFIEGPKPLLRILVHGLFDTTELEAWDPFMETHNATIVETEAITYADSVFHVQTFILPHKDKIDKRAFQKAGGPKGWIGQQGFYIYRNKRMLVSGDWLGLGGEDKSWIKEEQYKLARIRVDIPNDTDAAWQLDVKKSKAYPPPEIRERLLRLAYMCRKKARNVFSHRGAYGKRAKNVKYVRPWVHLKKGESHIYRIRREHPLIEAVLQQSGDTTIVEKMLRLLEETVPVEQIWLDTAENPENAYQPFADSVESEISELITSTYNILRDNGYNHHAALKRLETLEEFADHKTKLNLLQKEE